MNKTVFKYNLSFYYQSTIVYFIAFILYVVIRGEFSTGGFTVITRDPVIYFFGAVVLISLAALLYNMYKQRKLEISDSEIVFENRFKRKAFLVHNVREIKFKEGKGRLNNNIFRIIKIKLKNRRRPIIIRPHDYENEKKLIEQIEELKSRIEQHNV